MNSSSLEAVFANRISQSRSIRYRESIYAAIKEAILSGKLLPNQPLVEEQLAASLNVSRTPVREALTILAHENFIGPQGGRGLYVRSLSRQEFVDIFVANEAVEPYLARRAALLASEEQLADIAEALDRGDACAAALDTGGFLRASRDFHGRVGTAAGNTPLAGFVLSNEERTDMYLINYGKVVNGEQMEISNNEHRAILGALKNRDPEAAQRLAIVHAQSLRERFAELFQPLAEE